VSVRSRVDRDDTDTRLAVCVAVQAVWLVPAFVPGFSMSLDWYRLKVSDAINLVGLFMPMALVLILSMFAAPGLQTIVTLVMLVMMLFMAIEGVLLGRLVNNRVLEKFPDTTDTGFKLGWYAFVRASQIRKMRAPKPRVGPGDPV